MRYKRRIISVIVGLAIIGITVSLLASTSGDTSARTTSQRLVEFSSERLPAAVLQKIPAGTAVPLQSVRPPSVSPLSLGINTSAAPRNLFVDRTGRIFAGPPVDTGKPPAREATALAEHDVSASTTTGPYRRVYSFPGYNYLSAVVTLPCGDARLIGDQDQFDVETGYIYTGGWGDESNGQSGAAIDAGFQFDSFHTAYSLFIAYRGKLWYGSNLPRIKCGQPAAFTFSPESATSVGITATNIMDENGVHRTEHIAITQTNGEGWSTNGAGDYENGAIVKRMTTIGQPSSSGQSLVAFSNALRGMGASWETDGSYFGIDSQQKAQVQWRNVKIGRWAKGKLEGPATWQQRHTYGCHNVPSITKVVVKYVDSGSEDDGVLLSGPPSKPGNGLHSCSGR